MKQLWAPWRLDYVTHSKRGGCFLCRILEEDDDRGNLLVRRGAACAVVINRFPYNNGHLMVFPFRHVNDLPLLTGPERRETMELVSESIRALRRIMKPNGFNVGMNIGQSAGAGLEDHLHTHVLPRWSGDTNYMAAFADVKIIPQSLRDLWDRLYPVFNP